LQLVFPGRLLNIYVYRYSLPKFHIHKPKRDLIPLSHPTINSNFLLLESDRKQLSRDRFRLINGQFIGYIQQHYDKTFIATTIAKLSQINQNGISGPGEKSWMKLK
jgi:hypothetical protein